MTNSYSFDAKDFAKFLGAPIVIFLNNFLPGASAYDSILLTDAPTPVPEPASAAALLGLGLLGLGLRRRAHPGRSGPG